MIKLDYGDYLLHLNDGELEAEALRVLRRCRQHGADQALTELDQVKNRCATRPGVWRRVVAALTPLETMDA